ncbi:MAG TPA: aldo/keto reductase [Aggregatilineales bacterium]|nr:aldo/keto reductase [Aggregatilineales bacterium]
MIAKAPFGRIGHVSTRTIFGGAALGNVTAEEADRTLDVLLQYGVNHIDTAASYGDSELHVGRWMDRHRKEFFLATKTDQRTYQTARDQIHRSLERLRVSSVDLIQLHYLVDPAQWETAMGEGGALEAVVEARSQGLTRFIGVTGHDITVAAMHKRSLERFDFDSVLLPYNFSMMQNPDYTREFEAVLSICKERNVAVQTIKSLSRGAWAEHQAHTATTWYEPLTEQPYLDHAVHWVLGRPEVFLNTAGDIHLLPRVLDAAQRFTVRPTDAVMQSDAEGIGIKPLFV